MKTTQNFNHHQFLKAILGSALGLLFLFSTHTEASTRARYFFANSGRYSSMVSCDYAQEQAYRIVSLFSGANIETQCFGGISSTGNRPINLYVTFDLFPVTEQWKEKSFNSDAWAPACDFNTGLVQTLLPYFKNVEALISNDFCFDSRTSFSYYFKIFLLKK